MTEPLDPQTVRIAREAEGYYELGLYDDALQRAEDLIERGKLADHAWMLKAECLRSLGRWPDGSAAFEEAIRREPGSVAGHVGLGWCRKREGRLDLAIQAMELLLRSRPEEPVGLYNLACYLSLSGDRARSLDLLRRAIEAEDGYRDLAVREEDFAALRDDPAFGEIVAGT